MHLDEVDQWPKNIWKVDGFKADLDWVCRNQQ
jgi:hypothetical protein